MNYNAFKALFGSKNFCKVDTVAISFVFDKYYSIKDQLGLKVRLINYR